MILVASIDDGREAGRLLEDANMLWQMARNDFSIDESAGADASLAELRLAIEFLQEEHEAEHPAWEESMGIARAQLDGAADEEELAGNEFDEGAGGTGVAPPSEVESGEEEGDEPENASKAPACTQR